MKWTLIKTILKFYTINKLFHIQSHWYEYDLAEV